MAAMKKLSASVGSAPSDPVKSVAATNPIPSPAIENKPAPGLTGPKGLSPRTTYSRVNVGPSIVPDAGTGAQKGSPVRGMEFLPAKLAAQHEVSMTMKERPLLQDMVKAAMAGAAHRVSVNAEAARQQLDRASVKTASVSPLRPADDFSSEMVSKLADAINFIADQIVKEADNGSVLKPGEGPGALTVLEATSEGSLPDAGQSGQATEGNQPPKDPSLQTEQVQVGKANTGLETNDDTTHPAQPVEPISNEKTSGIKDVAKAGVSKAKDVAKGAKEVLTGKRWTNQTTVKGSPLDIYKKKEMAKTVGAYAGIGAAGGGAAYAATKGKKKESSAPIAMIRKVAEDAINPAQISSPANVDPAQPPPGVSEAETGVPSEPSDVTSQKRLIQSNDAAINYTKGEAKADPKKDVNQLLNEPALSSSTDKTLNQVFDNTGAAGVKISSAKPGMRKTAQQASAQRALLMNLLEKVSSDQGTKAARAAAEK